MKLKRVSLQYNCRKCGGTADIYFKEGDGLYIEDLFERDCVDCEREEDK